MKRLAVALHEEDGDNGISAQLYPVSEKDHPLLVSRMAGGEPNDGDNPLP